MNHVDYLNKVFWIDEGYFQTVTQINPNKVNKRIYVKKKAQMSPNKKYMQYVYDLMQRKN